jgi:hypothetical protein
VAGDEDRTAPLGDPAEQGAKPANARGVEAVGGLVEDEQLGVAEQRHRQAKPLAHAERIRLHPPSARGGQPDELQHLLDPGRRDLRREPERPQVVAAGAAGEEVVGLEHRPDSASGTLELAVAAAEDERPARGRLGEP